MFDHNSIMALKQLIAGQQEDEDIVDNPYKGSMLNPSNIGRDQNDSKKQIAKPFAKVQAKIGEKFVPKKIPQQSKEKQQKKSNIAAKHQIWTQQEVKDLPILKEDPRPRPNYSSFYRQSVGTQDVFLGLSGVDPSSNFCKQITYKIQLPDTAMKDIQLDLNEKQMVIQTKRYYLIQHFQYKMEHKKAKAKFISDKGILQIVLPIIRTEDF